jgi:hypothetical protein
LPEVLLELARTSVIASRHLVHVIAEDKRVEIALHWCPLQLAVGHHVQQHAQRMTRSVHLA